MKQFEEQNLIKKRAVQRLLKYYPYDEESKTFTIHFHYAFVHEVCEDDHIVSKKIQFKSEVLKEIENRLNSIPKGYHADIKITFDDYEGYTPENVLEAFNDITFDHYFAGSQKYKTTSIRAGIVALVGTFWIILAHAGDFFNWWGNPTSVVSNVISGILSIFATVFIWEALNVVVIHQNHFIKEFRHFITRVRYIIIEDNKENEAKELLKDIGPYSHYKVNAVSNWNMVLASFLFFGVIMLRLIRYFGAFFISHYEIQQYEIILSPILLVIALVSAIFGILLYEGYYKLLIPTGIVNVALIGVAIVNVALAYSNNIPVENRVSALIIIGATVLFTVGYIIKCIVVKKFKRIA